MFDYPRARWLSMLALASLHCGGTGTQAAVSAGDAGVAADGSSGSSSHDGTSGGSTGDGGIEPRDAGTDTANVRATDAVADVGVIAEAGAPTDAGDTVLDAGSPSEAGKQTDAVALGPDACTAGTPLAFPGAVGFGAAATGGRGSAAYHVTTLDDTGATGSLRDAVSAGHRTIVFDVGGIINLTSALSVSSDVTIAGQTAPGGGIAVEGREVSFSNSSNVIVRDVRFREGTNDPDTGKSGIAADSSMLIILDHVSVEFGQWDNMDINGGMNVTVQRSIVADPIGQQFNAHCTSGNLTWFEDILSSAHNRSPLAKGDTQYVNNVVYNFQAGYTAGDTSGVFKHDIVNNYFITGPSTTNAGDAMFQVGSQLMYFQGNMLDSNHDGTLNGSGMGLPGGVTALTAPFAPSTTTLSTASAADAYASDVAHSGALPQDDVDALVIADVKSLGTTGHLWTSESQTNLANGGYGTLAGGTPPLDTDGDGIPDAWETMHGLNPNDPADALLIYGCTGYTNLEEYLNQLADSLM
jgi:hypothetical protein